MNSTPPNRICVDGKFFRSGSDRFLVKGVAYGPFLDASGRSGVLEEPQTLLDLELVRTLGANVLRLYELPPPWYMDAALRFGLRVWLDVPWSKHLAFLDSRAVQADARQAVRAAARAVAFHPAFFALNVANEIPPDIVRWHGPDRVAKFIDVLIAEAKNAGEGCLCSYGNFPSTESLRPSAADFICWNVYLHERNQWESYLARLQHIAGNLPLVIGECGADTLREGEAQQGELVGWQIESAFQMGCAGCTVFRLTDEWGNDGREVTEWAFGLTRRDRTPKPSFAVVAEQFRAAPALALDPTPRVSIVIASYNGAATLRSCLQSLRNLRYPNFEVLLIDDGSTDATRAVAAEFPEVRAIFHPSNLGLSAARNTGIEHANGEIIAFTDSDCEADPEWLNYLISDMVRGDFAGVGGPNLLPADDQAVAAAVMAAPGGPAHVMLDDQEAEHLPGCNMAFNRARLLAVDGFDPVFRAAGDDVDLCWRLQERGFRLGFSPAGFVWHHRRATITAYLKQQRGYGHAEALLMRKHPARFNSIGGGSWRGRIYEESGGRCSWWRPVIYFGHFGSAPFQQVDPTPPRVWAAFLVSFEYAVGLLAPLLLLAPFSRIGQVLLLAGLAAPMTLCLITAMGAPIAADRRRWWSRSLVMGLHLLQPWVRGFARWRRLLFHPGSRMRTRESLESMALDVPGGWNAVIVLVYWDEHRHGRAAFLEAIAAQLKAGDWVWRSNSRAEPIDLEIEGSPWVRARVTTMSEKHPRNIQILHCRIHSAFSQLAWFSLGWLSAVVAAFGLILNRKTHWSWLLCLLPIAAVVWFIRLRKQQLRLLFHQVCTTAAACGLQPHDLKSTRTLI